MRRKYRRSCPTALATLRGAPAPAPRFAPQPSRLMSRRAPQRNSHRSEHIPPQPDRSRACHHTSDGLATHTWAVMLITQHFGGRGEVPAAPPSLVVPQRRPCSRGDREVPARCPQHPPRLLQSPPTPFRALHEALHAPGTAQEGGSRRARRRGTRTRERVYAYVRVEDGAAKCRHECRQPARCPRQGPGAAQLICGMFHSTSVRERCSRSAKRPEAVISAPAPGPCSTIGRGE